MKGNQILHVLTVAFFNDYHDLQTEVAGAYSQDWLEEQLRLHAQLLGWVRSLIVLYNQGVPGFQVDMVQLKRLLQDRRPDIGAVYEHVCNCVNYE